MTTADPTARAEKTQRSLHWNLDTAHIVSGVRTKDTLLLAIFSSQTLKSAHYSVFGGYH